MKETKISLNQLRAALQRAYLLGENIWVETPYNSYKGPVAAITSKAFSLRLPGRFEIILSFSQITTIKENRHNLTVAVQH